MVVAHFLEDLYVSLMISRILISISVLRGSMHVGHVIGCCSRLLTKQLPRYMCFQHDAQS